VDGCISCIEEVVLGTLDIFNVFREQKVILSNKSCIEDAEHRRLKAASFAVAGLIFLVAR
jgi:hypothetical protein